MGRHPHAAGGFDASDLEEIERAAGHPEALAIGETGLDYYRDLAPRADQRRAFEAQLELASRVDLPVVIHTRAAEEDTFALLADQAGELTVIMHCFSAPDRLEECVDRGYICSFAGNVTYPKAGALQAAARDLPGELLLVETDSPYLAPQPVRGKPNEPANVVRTAEHVAELRRSQLLGARGPRRAKRRARASAGNRGVPGGCPARFGRRACGGFVITRSAPTASSGRTSWSTTTFSASSSAPPRSTAPLTWCWRSAAGSACCPSTWRRGFATCTSSRWTARCGRRSRRRSRPTRTSTSWSATRCGSTLPPSIHRRARSWRTFPTASRPACCSERCRSFPALRCGWRWFSGRWPSASPPGRAHGSTARRR